MCTRQSLSVTLAVLTCLFFLAVPAALPQEAAPPEAPVVDTLVCKTRLPDGAVFRLDYETHCFRPASLPVQPGDALTPIDTMDFDRPRSLLRFSNHGRAVASVVPVATEEFLACDPAWWVATLLEGATLPLAKPQALPVTGLLIPAGSTAEAVYTGRTEELGVTYATIDISMRLPKGALMFPLLDDKALLRSAEFTGRAWWDTAAGCLARVETKLISESEDGIFPDAQKARLDYFNLRAFPDCWMEPGALVVTGKGAGTVLPHAAVDAEAVNRAIDKGAAYLKDALKKKPRGEKSVSYAEPGICDGERLLMLLAILKCGVSPGDPAILRDFDALFAQPPGPIVYDTYTPGLYLMAGEAWLTAVAKLPDEGREPHTKRIALVTKNMKAAVAMLLEKFDKLQGWGIPDLSNTQYGILGLHAAVQAGVFVPRGNPRFYPVWENVLQLLLDSQVDSKRDPLPLECAYRPPFQENSPASVEAMPDGWGYLLGARQPQGAQALHSCTYSMTCTGIASMVIACEYLGQRPLKNKTVKEKLARTASDSVNRGLAWMQEAYDIFGGHGAYSTRYSQIGGIGLYYYLYALERAGVLADVRFIGKHDWYGEGAMLLVGSQWPSGRWGNEGIRRKSPMPGIPDGAMGFDYTDTAFALLFLKRATVKVTSGVGYREPEDGK